MDGTRLRIEIDGYWTSGDFAKLFSEMELLNEFAHFGETKIDGQTALPLRYFRGTQPRLSPIWTLDYELEAETESNITEALVKGYIRDFIGYPSDLQVKEVLFASPGFVDLLGAGKIVGHLSKFILGVTDRWLATDDRKLARDHKRQTILRQKIANAESLLKLSNKAGLDADTRRQLIRRVLEVDYYLETKILDGQVTDVRTIDDEPRRPPHAR
jgi:hypothetical protein